MTLGSYVCCWQLALTRTRLFRSRYSGVDKQPGGSARDQTCWRRSSVPLQTSGCHMFSVVFGFH